ncbi:hypothetical protein B0H19DRAFT_429710 [Mycena capillaripes]|nr:hypothetical protein B0H19DRAFT_429710 [Mycena capillaripes]
MQSLSLAFVTLQTLPLRWRTSLYLPPDCCRRMRQLTPQFFLSEPSRILEFNFSHLHGTAPCIRGTAESCQLRTTLR